MILHSAIPRGLTARIAGFHPAGPGSTLYYSIGHTRDFGVQ